MQFWGRSEVVNGETLYYRRYVPENLPTISGGRPIFDWRATVLAWTVFIILISSSSFVIVASYLGKGIQSDELFIASLCLLFLGPLNSIHNRIVDGIRLMRDAHSRQIEDLVEDLEQCIRNTGVAVPDPLATKKEAPPTSLPERRVLRVKKNERAK